MRAPAFITAENVSHRLGFAPDRHITASGGTLSAAIWRFEHDSRFELHGPAVENTDLISMPVSGHHHHTYFGDGRRKWSLTHPPFHMNMVVAGEEPRGIFRSERPFSYLHVYVPHAMVERVAVEIGAVKAGRSVALVDPMCSRDPLVEHICRQITREMNSPDGCSRMMIDSLGQQLVVRLLRQHSSVSGSKAFAARSGAGYRDWRVRRAIEYLDAHLCDDVGLNDVAKVVGLSTARLAGLFREGTGEPPHRWLMNRRFMRACELLGRPSLTITEIAHQCGFASSQHLATVMRRRLGTTPTAYRSHLLN
ncbi:AraC family transcriptional regulator [Mycobacterium conspicuum]|jgi:AraC family transcriptional regulator|uniref:AraC family transcriptional regulator n=1 Tax=Mycobacterium conspicuum TaxID=44010 RepID=A0A1X1TNF4_9MYCO|nr:AraC family transcriptional regulator [Mycobacterium conspicuum]ORV46112.1 AraC family transcriptional regulator [Mycobacterium conspicuum]BBZ37938.1 AraC family transcriptional regulator [Mycobacterium conspicuum]